MDESMRTSQLEAVRDHLVVALDLASREAAVDLVERLADHVAYYKVSPQLFTRHGPAYLDDLVEAGAEKLFFDVKYHDIPNTVEAAIEEVADHARVSMVTVHASGGREMIRRASDAASDRLSVIAVTALTSLSDEEVGSMTGGLDADQWADQLADVAVEAGADGLVCSAREVGDLRARYGDDVTLVTPGIRPTQMASDDQVRTTTPREALDAGSDYLVMGRPIYRAEDPVRQVARIGETLSETS